MAKDSSATMRQYTPQVNQTTPTTTGLNATNEFNDVDPIRKNDEDSSRRERIAELAEIICRGADESAAALLVLMDQVEESTDPRALAHTVKHFAFTRCGELNLFRMVDAQIAAVERELCGGKE